MSHQYRNLPQRSRAPENPGRPVFGKRAAPPEPARPSSVSASASRASKAFCALMIVLAAVAVVWAI